MWPDFVLDELLSMEGLASKAEFMIDKTKHRVCGIFSSHDIQAELGNAMSIDTEQALFFINSQKATKLTRGQQILIDDSAYRITQLSAHDGISTLSLCPV